MVKSKKKAKANDNCAVCGIPLTPDRRGTLRCARCGREPGIEDQPQPDMPGTVHPPVGPHRAKRP